MVVTAMGEPASPPPPPDSQQCSNPNSVETLSDPAAPPKTPTPSHPGKISDVKFEWNSNLIYYIWDQPSLKKKKNFMKKNFLRETTSKFP